MSTQGQVELPSEIHNGGQEFADSIDANMFGGICAAIQPCAKATEDFCIGESDVNSLYPYIMAQRMPVGGIEKIDVSRDEGRKLIAEWKPDDSLGYWFEVTCSVPDHLHDHFDFAPIARMDSDPSVLSKKQQATFQLLQPSIGPRLIPYLGRQERVGKTVDELQILQEEGLVIEERRYVWSTFTDLGCRNTTSSKMRQRLQ